MWLLGRVPATGDIAQWEQWRLEVVDLDGKRVDKVLASRVLEPVPAERGMPRRPMRRLSATNHTTEVAGVERLGLFARARCPLTVVGDGFDHGAAPAQSPEQQGCQICPMASRNQDRLGIPSSPWVGRWSMIAPTSSPSTWEASICAVG